MCWYFHLILAAAGSNSTFCDLLCGTSSTSDQLAASQACCSTGTCSFLHQPIGMFLEGFGNSKGSVIVGGYDRCMQTVLTQTQLHVYLLANSLTSWSRSQDQFLVHRCWGHIGVERIHCRLCTPAQLWLNFSWCLYFWQAQFSLSNKLGCEDGAELRALWLSRKYYTQEQQKTKDHYLYFYAS